MTIATMYHAAHLMSVAACATAPLPSYSHNAVTKVWVADVEQQPKGAVRNSLAPVAATTKADAPAVVNSLRQRFAAVRRLQDGWDGPTSKAPDAQVLTRAAKLLDGILVNLNHLEAPHIVPVADGGIQAEWYSASHRMEAYFDVDGEILAWTANRKTGVEMEEDGYAAVQLLHDWAAAREYDSVYSA